MSVCFCEVLPPAKYFNGQCMTVVMANNAGKNAAAQLDLLLRDVEGLPADDVVFTISPPGLKADGEIAGEQ